MADSKPRSAQHLDELDYFSVSISSLVGNAQRRAIAAQDTKQRIEIRGGQLTPAAQYRNSYTPIPFVCPFGHSVAVSRDKLLAGAWCQDCYSNHKSRPEAISRLIMETIFSEPFPKAHPEWLRSKNGTQLELDGFNEAGSLAFEHHGSFHGKHNPFYHKKKDHFENQQVLDRTKAAVLADRQIDLVVIWDLCQGWSVDRMFSHVEEAIRYAGIAVPAYDRSGFDLAAVYADHELLSEFLEKISSKGGKLLSSYAGLKQVVTLTCSDPEHPVWYPTPASIIYQQTWCPRCGDARVSEAGIRKSKAAFVQWLADNRDTQVHYPDGEFIDASRALILTCTNGHIESLTFTQIRVREKDPKLGPSWCLQCRKKLSDRLKKESLAMKLSAQTAEANEISGSLGLLVTGNPHSGSRSFELTCAIDSSHKLFLTIYQMRKLVEVAIDGQWACSYCMGNHRKTAEDAGRLASDLGGEFLDDTLVTVKTKHRWRFGRRVVKTSYDSLNKFRRDHVHKGGELPFDYRPGQNLPWTEEQASLLGALVGLRFMPGQMMQGVNHQYHWGGSEGPLTLNAVEIRARKRFGREAVQKIRKSD